MKLPSLSSPQPPPHIRMTTSSVAISMVRGGAMDGGTAATAPPSHSHHLDFPFVTCPPPTSHLMLIVASSPLLRQQRADANTLSSSSPRQRATAPPPPPFNKILRIDKRCQTTYGVRRWRACVGGMRRWRVRWRWRGAAACAKGSGGGVRRRRAAPLCDEGRHVEGGDEKICQRYVWRQICRTFCKFMFL
jgi:hypothetical protein